MADRERTVFVVHGRDYLIRDEFIKKFLPSIGLSSLRWQDAKASAYQSGLKSPTILEIVMAGLADAQAVVILLTPDELVRLRPDLTGLVVGDGVPGRQARPNVILEAGMALMARPKNTVLVRVGEMRNSLSDLSGLSFIDLSNSTESRELLVQALKDAGCKVDDLKASYLSSEVAGDFAPKDLLDNSLPAPVLLSTSIAHSAEAVFTAGRNELARISHDEVLIYAPTGVWVRNDAKQQWFDEIAACLRNSRKKKPGVGASLGQLTAVYGLPDRSDSAAYAIELDGLEDKRLEPFHGLDRARLYSLDLDTSQMPGTGVVVIDDLAFVGFAIDGISQVDFGLIVDHDSSYANSLRRWFSKHVIEGAGTTILQQIFPRGICLADGINAARRAALIPERPNYCKVNGACRYGTS